MSKEVSRSEEVKKILKSQTPVAIFVYMIGCPHCEKMDPIWEDLAKKRSGTDFVKIEQNNVPQSEGITGFPFFMVIEKGKRKKQVGGEMPADKLESKLFSSGGFRLAGGRRRRTGRLGGRVRKVAHRTLRRHVSLV